MEKTFDISVGQIVKSKAGRDMGRLFLVLDVIDSSYVFVVDGKLRKLSNPKKKKIRHLMIYKDVVKLDKDSNYFNDSYIRKQLEPFNRD